MRSLSKMSGRAPAIQDWAPPPARNPPGRGFPGPPPPGLPPPRPPGFPQNGFGPGPKLTRGLGLNKNAWVITVVICVKVIVGCAVDTGKVFSCIAISSALRALLSVAVDSNKCWDSAGVEGGEGVTGGGSKATDSKFAHSFGHGRSGLLGSSLCWTSSLVIAFCSSMPFLLFPR